MWVKERKWQHGGKLNLPPFSHLTHNLTHTGKTGGKQVEISG